MFRTSRARIERPIPRTHAPKMTAKRFRIEIGKPEKGARITRTPRRMRVLVRDIGLVYQGVTMTTNSPRTVSGWMVK